MNQLPTSKTFQWQYPFSFRLEDKDETPAIYIVSEDDVDKQTLTLTIGNDAEQPIYLGGVSQTVLPAVLEIKPILTGLLNAGRTLGPISQDTKLNSAQQALLTSFWDQLHSLVAEINKEKWDNKPAGDLVDFINAVKSSQDNLLALEPVKNDQSAFNEVVAVLKALNDAFLELEAAAWNLHAHFELRFRKGVLSPASMGADHRLQLDGQPSIKQSSADSKKPANTGAWQLSPPIRHPDQPWVSIYLLRLGETWALRPNDSFSLVLTSISAARGHGTRDTQVELVPLNVYFQSDKEPTQNPITQVREQILKVINRQGSPHIPLHAGFIGPNTLLNDDQPHTGFKLQLRITNTSPKKTIAFDELSKLTLHFFSSDAEDTEGAIGTTDNVEKIGFFLDNKEIDTDDSSEEAEETFWTIDYDTLTEDPAKTQLAPREYFTIYVDLDKFSTNHPQGITFLTIRYENIPGYWDGDLQCPIEVRPLLIQTALPVNQDKKFNPGKFRIDGVCNVHGEPNAFYFISGLKCWKVEQGAILAGFPKPLSELISTSEPNFFELLEQFKIHDITIIEESGDLYYLLFLDTYFLFFKIGETINLQNNLGYFNEEGLGFPRDITHPDAVFTTKENREEIWIFLIGKNYWTRAGFTESSVGPYPISNHPEFGIIAPHAPFDAACASANDHGVLYFFKENQYWEVKENKIVKSGTLADWGFSEKHHPNGEFTPFVKLDTGERPLTIATPIMNVDTAGAVVVGSQEHPRLQLGDKGSLTLRDANDASLTLDPSGDKPGLASTKDLHLSAASNGKVVIGQNKKMTFTDGLLIVDKLRIDNTDFGENDLKSLLNSTIRGEALNDLPVFGNAAAITSLEGKIYFLAGNNLSNRLYKAEPGKKDMDQLNTWIIPVAMTSLAETRLLYIVAKNEANNYELFSYDPERKSKKLLKYFTGAWNNTVAMTSLERTEYLYIVQDKNLYIVSPITGQYWREKNKDFWDKTTAMTSLKKTGLLYIVQNNELYKVDPKLDKETDEEAQLTPIKISRTPNEWSNTTSMTSSDVTGLLYFVRNDRIYSFDPENGNKAIVMVGANDAVITTLNNKIYAMQEGWLYEI